MRVALALVVLVAALQRNCAFVHTQIDALAHLFKTHAHRWYLFAHATRPVSARNSTPLPALAHILHATRSPSNVPLRRIPPRFVAAAAVTETADEFDEHDDENASDYDHKLELKRSVEDDEGDEYEDG